MLDLLLRHATVVDGTGAPRRVADVGVRDGRVVSVGTADEGATRTLDAEGLVVAPGFIDLHTHYDAQALWDPGLTPSPLHGVTTVIGGNCGFSIAPLAEEDAADAEQAAHAEYVMRMMATVEGMPLDALRQGPAWDWRGFGAWLSRLDGRLAVNAGFLVGHSTLRRVAMGPAAVGEKATPAQLERMVALVHRALADGALGFSSSLGEAHTDGDGAPVPSRAASAEELVALAGAVRDHEGTTLEFIPAMGEIPAERMELMADMSLAGNRPLNWNLLGSLSPVEIYRQQLSASDVAAARGATVLALTLPDLMRLRTSNILDGLPGWREVAELPEAERRRAVADPDVRRRLQEGIASAAARGLSAVTSWDLIEIAEGRSPATEAHAGRSVAAVAAELGVAAVDVLLDQVLVERLPLTLVLPSLVPGLGASREGWEERAAVWRDQRVLIGGSDAGAHVDLMCHANYPTVVLGHAARELGVVSLEEAVQLLTGRPAGVLGLRDRGVLTPGCWADLVVFDPERVGSAPARIRHDLPGGSARLYAESCGIEHVYVAGQEVVAGGALTGALGGTALRSGRDTATVAVAGPRS